MAMGAQSLVNKFHNVPGFSSVHDALQMARTESKTAVESTMQALDDIKKELKQAANASQQTLEGSASATKYRMRRRWRPQNRPTYAERSWR
ncbi:Defensin domain protein, partial [Metarhizium hybridum]